ncbi:MAG TPA: bis-aminopropyl spermidine synthase family protein [Gemmatimonadaceae bacterium]|jgi:predicted methyltransferase
MTLDLRQALNAISDVVTNRPLPLREFDQIYMKLGDMVVHAEFVARRFDKGRLVFVGDGDAVGLSVAHLVNERVLEYGPREITVLDFDERMVNSVTRFAEESGFAESAKAVLYNVVDPIPEGTAETFDGFHINPPWGQHNNGESVVVFLERAAALTKVGGSGVVVIADDATRAWTNNVLARTQKAALELGLVLEQMIPSLHSYHLDDAPELRSCAMVFRKIKDSGLVSGRLSAERLEDFYGRSQALRIQYVREVATIERGRASDRTYRFEELVNSGC